MPDQPTDVAISSVNPDVLVAYDAAIGELIDTIRPIVGDAALQDLVKPIARFGHTVQETVNAFAVAPALAEIARLRSTQPPAPRRRHHRPGRQDHP